MSKFDALFEDEDDIFGGTPESKYWDIFNQMSEDQARDSFDKILERMAAMERMLMKEIDEEALDTHVQRYILSNSAEIDAHKKSLYMELAGELIYRLSD